MKSNLGRVECAVLQNKTGGTLAQGDVVIIDLSNAKGVSVTNVLKYIGSRIGVVLEVSGIADDEWGLIAFSGVIPKLNLNGSASIGDWVTTSTTNKQGHPHTGIAPQGAFAQVLESGTSPSALLLGHQVTVDGGGVFFAPTGLTGATATSRYVGSTALGAPVSGTFSTGDWVIDQTGVIWVCISGGTPGTWATPPAVPNGYQPYAYPINMVNNAAFTTALALAANGGSLAIPIRLEAPMLLQSVSIRNTDTSGARIWGWDLYLQTGLTEILNRVAACSADESYTASAASTRTLDAGSAPVALGAGVYWLVIQNRHGSNTFGLGTTAVSSAFAQNTGQTKTTTNPNGATLDFIAATWAKQTATVAARLNGRVFGESAAF